MSDSGIFLLDSDFFVVCAGSGLLPEVITSAGFQLTQARRLEPLPSMLRRGRLARDYPEGVRQKAAAWCAEIGAIEQAPSAKRMDQLIALADIDPGEAFLFALAAEHNGAVVATGDKRACRALGGSRDIHPLKSLLRGKILSLEAALQLLLKRIDYQTLAQALSPVRETSQTLRILLSQGDQTPESSFREGLDSFLKELSSQSGQLLFDPR